MNIKLLLDEKVALYNNPKFIPSDPISIPHQFIKKEDIEIAAFLTATISWGNRKAIIKSANELMTLMDNSPYEFTLNHSNSELKALSHYKYRTFNFDDLSAFLHSLQNIYQYYGGLEEVFSSAFGKTKNMMDAIAEFREIFFSTDHLVRTGKHIANPVKKSAAKRINMFLRWMVRNDEKGVDFGLWNDIPTSSLICPLDIHSGNVARKLGLLDRSQNDRLAAELLTQKLRSFDQNDPVKYDFALFGMGVFEGLK